jgi:hypothetical protein
MVADRVAACQFPLYNLRSRRLYPNQSAAACSLHVRSMTILLNNHSATCHVQKGAEGKDRVVIDEAGVAWSIPEFYGERSHQLCIRVRSEANH